MSSNLLTLSWLSCSWVGQSSLCPTLKEWSFFCGHFEVGDTFFLGWAFGFVYGGHFWQAGYDLDLPSTCADLSQICDSVSCKKGLQKNPARKTKPTSKCRKSDLKGNRIRSKMIKDLFDLFDLVHQTADESRRRSPTNGLCFVGLGRIRWAGLGYLERRESFSCWGDGLGSLKKLEGGNKLSKSIHVEMGLRPQLPYWISWCSRTWTSHHPQWLWWLSSIQLPWRQVLVGQRKPTKPTLFLSTNQVLKLPKPCLDASLLTKRVSIGNWPIVKLTKRDRVFVAAWTESTEPFFSWRPGSFVPSMGLCWWRSCEICEWRCQSSSRWRILKLVGWLGECWPGWGHDSKYSKEKCWGYFLPNPWGYANLFKCTFIQLFKQIALTQACASAAALVLPTAEDCIWLPSREQAMEINKAAGLPPRQGADSISEPKPVSGELQ